MYASLELDKGFNPVRSLVIGCQHSQHLSALLDKGLVAWCAIRYHVSEGYESGAKCEDPFELLECQLAPAGPLEDIWGSFPSGAPWSPALLLCNCKIDQINGELLLDISKVEWLEPCCHLTL